MEELEEFMDMEVDLSELSSHDKKKFCETVLGGKFTGDKCIVKVKLEKKTIKIFKD